MPGSPLALQRALSRRLLPLAYATAAVICFILALTWIALTTQVSLAGFLNGESVWSKAQKQAVIDLDIYAGSGNADDFARFRRNFELLQSDRWARDAVAQPTYDSRKVTEAFSRGDVMSSAETGMIFMLRHLSWAPYIGRALSDWRSTDAPIDELGAVAEALRTAHASGTADPAGINRLRRRIRTINEIIEPRSADFSLTVAQGAEWFARILFISVLAASLVACLLWLWMARRVLAGIRGSEERYRLLFDSAPDAIVMVDETSGRILAANRTASTWTGRDPQELLGIPYADLFEQDSKHDESPGGGELRGDDGRTRPVETQSSMAVWGEKLVRQAIIRDVSERVESDRERRIAAKALASIAEGVIIADAKRHIVSANAAATQTTGFTNENLIGMSLDETRRMHDGGRLPATIWDEIIATHHWSGEVESSRKDGSSYPEMLSISTIRDSDQRVKHYVAVFSNISIAKADQYRLQHLAAHDALTGLANRAEFQRHCEVAIERAARERRATAVMFIDLDAFKFVNDSYSHAVGDNLLKLVAERIRHELRAGDIAGRIGGDEFTVLVRDLTLREDVAALADRMVSALSEPFRIDDYEIVLSASIGIAGFPLDGGDALTLIANADAAMYAAKTEERNAWRFYVPMMQADTRQRLLLATELRQALQKEEFRILYQPSVELSSGRIVAAEALLRWKHPERGEVMPSEFIPVAESIGLIHRIDEWVMQAVCEQIHAWDESDLPRIRIAVNVSARWFGHPGFVESIRRALRVHEVSPQRIALEITEGAMLRLGEETEHTMRALNALGVGVAIDDFGTGYSSMAYLKLPAVAYLKIDRSFVTGLPGSANDAAITTAMLAMSGSLGLITIAEGIETEEQHEFLKRAGCVEGQGFLYSYPLPPAAIEHMLRPQRPSAGTKLKLVPRRN
ncbi:MAG: putative bifunctional diguanylate cyclase/phosphodiesterase [Rhodanobacteraceae bacterium]